MVDCDKGIQDCTKQCPTKSYCCIARASNDCRMTTLSTQWYTLHCVTRGYDNGNEGWSWQACKIVQATTNLSHGCGLITSAITKAWGASNYNWSQCYDSMSRTQQSFFIVILQGATTITDECKGRTKWLPCNNQIFMLSITGCNDDHIAPRNKQQRKYAEVGYGKYAKDGTGVLLRQHVWCQGRVWWVPKEAAFVKEGKDESLATRALVAYIVQDNNEPLATKGLRAAYAVQGNDEPLATKSDWAMTFNDCKGTKVLAVKLIMPITTSHHCNDVS